MIIYGSYKNTDTVIGTDFTVCDACLSKYQEDHNVPRHKAINALSGKFIGKQFLKVNETMICEDCIKKTYNKFFKSAEENAIMDAIDDPELNLDDVTEEEAAKESIPEKKGRGKKNAK